jgi:ABC-2 type transport system permease protein
MTRNLIALNIRALFSRMFLRNRNQKKRSPAITVLVILLAVYVVGAFMSLSAMTFLGLNKQLFSMELGWLYFSFMGIGIFTLCFVGSVFAAQTQLFNAKDNELLLSLPIRPSAILTGRLASLLLLEYLFDVFIALPAFVIWVMYQPVTAAGIVFFILTVLTVPLLSLALASFFAWLIALLTSRMRNKNILTIILWLAFFYLYFRAVSSLSGHLNQLVAAGIQMADAIKTTFFPAYHLGVAIADGNAVSFLIYLACVVVPFVLMVLILSANFIRIATANRGAAKIKYKEKALKVSGVRTAFTNKELRHFWSNPMYILNSALGGAFMLVGAVVLVINRAAVFAYLDKFNKSGLPLSAATLVILALGVISALNFVSAPSISLEGKSLWIAKSLPVPTMDVLMAKVQMHMLVCGIPAFVAALICAVALQVSALEFFLILVIPVLLTFLVALFGVVINLQFPKFDWINELQPIKQSVSVLLTMFGGWAFLAALILLYVFVLSSLLAVELYLVLCAALFAVLCGVLYGYLRKGGSRRFEALNN